MSDIINITDVFAGVNPASITERNEDNDTQQTEGAEEATRPGRGRGQLRAAFAQSRRRARPAFLVDLSQRAQEATANRAAREPEEAPQPAPQGRAALRQQFQQARQAFRETNQPGQAGGGGEEQRGVVTIPVGLERGARQGGGTATGAAAQPAPAGEPERPGFQVEAQPTIMASREPPRLDGVRMAASFQQTALGNALNQNQPPAARQATRMNTGNLGQGAGTNVGPGAALAGQTATTAGGVNAPDRPDLGGAAPALRGSGRGDQPAQGPLGRVQSRLENPANNLLNTDQRTSLGADRVALAQGRIGANQLEQRPILERVNPGARNESDNALGAGIGTENINRVTGQAGQADGPGNNLNANALLFNTPEQPLARANAAPGATRPNDQAGLRRDIRPGGDPVVPNQAPAPPQEANLANNLAGAAGEPAGIGENVRPTAVPTPGVAPPENPLEPEQPQPGLLRNEPAAPLDGNPGQAAPALDVLQAALEPEQPAVNPAPPAPEPTETPAEQAAAIRATPAEVADAELRDSVPSPIEPPPGATARETPAAPPEAAAANAAVVLPTIGGAEQAGGPAGAPEAAQVPAAGLPAEAGAEEENGPEAVPPAGAPPVAAAGGRPPRAGAPEGPANEEAPAAAPGAGVVPNEPPPAGEEGGLEARATAAYEQQQMENRTTEPNERRTVTELFIR